MIATPWKRGQSAPPSYATPDASVVAKTDDAHPATQCRLDTYLQGALCAKPLEEAQADDAPAPGACTAAAGFSAGLRPRCWYKAASGQAAPAKWSKLLDGYQPVFWR